MTYENAVAWAVDNVPMSMYESYEDWASDVESELQTPELFESQRFIGMLQDAWVRTGRSLESEDNEPSYEQQYYTPPPQQEAKPTKAPEPTLPKYPEEQAREIPKTGSAPIVTTRQYDFTTTKAPQKEGFFKRLLGRFRRGR